MSFYTALTGLNAATAQLGVTSNNIANVGTSGFKRSRANFGDIFATSPLQQASSVIGQGVSLKQVSQEFSQGNIQVSSNALDLAITGDGFFPLKSSDGLQDIYTRNGSFTMNDQYNVVNSAGQALMAASVDSSGKADLGNLNRLAIPKQTSGEAKQTSQVQLGLNLPADATLITQPFNRGNPATYNKSTALTVYDQGGNNYLATVYYAKTQNASQANPTNKWQTYVYIGDTQVNAALIQATDPNGSSYYVNKYGQLKTAKDIGASALSSNTTTQMFTLNLLNTQLTSVPATLTGTAVAADTKNAIPNSWDLTADKGVDFSTLSDNQKLALKNLFQVNVDGSSTPVTVDLSALATQKGLMNGTAIANAMTDQLNKQFGDDNYWDFSTASVGSAGQKFTLNVNGSDFGIDMSKMTEQKRLTFSAATATAQTLTIGPATIQVAVGDSAKTVATKVKNALDATSFITAHPGRSIADNGDGTLTLTAAPDDGTNGVGSVAISSSITNGVSVTSAQVQQYLSATQKLAFGAATADGNITVAGITVPLLAQDSAATVATKVKAAINASSFITANPGREVVQLLDDNDDLTGELSVVFNTKDANPDLLTFADTSTTGATCEVYIQDKFYGALDKLSTDDVLKSMQQKIDAQIAASTDPAIRSLKVTVGYDMINQGFTFKGSSGANVGIHGGTPSQAAANDVLGLSKATVLADPDTGTYDHASEVVANGNPIRTAPDPTKGIIGDQRYGVKVVFDSVNQKFQVMSGTTGDESSVEVLAVSDFAKMAFGLRDGVVGVNPRDAIRGISSKPASLTGTQVAINVSNNFGVDSTNNSFVVNVDNVTGTVVVPPGANYTLDGFVAELQKRINTLADPSGNTVSGVTVGFDRLKNVFTFTSGTTGSDSFIQVTGSATWGLSSGPSGRGATSSWIKPTQYTDYSSGQPIKMYINNLGVQTSSADGYEGLPEWSPIYLEKGELTFDTSGKLMSPLSGAQLDTVFLPDGKGSLRININYSKSTQYSSPFAVLSQSQDGAPEGELVGVNISNDGLVNASYSNGSQKSLGKIVLANFTNAGGLRQIGDSSYYASSSSGTATLGEAGGAGFGTVRAGATERANVDLTQELVDLITEQRNFQANAKAIETSSSLTQTITNIRS